MTNALLAGAFYHFSPILFPYHQEPDTTKGLLGSTDFDTLIAEAGSVSLETLLSSNKSIRRIIWVTKAGSKHLDWNEVPEGIGGKIDVTTWHDLVEEKKGTTPQIPARDAANEPPSVYTFWPNKTGKYELVEYTQKVINDSGFSGILLTSIEPYSWCSSHLFFASTDREAHS